MFPINEKVPKGLSTLSADGPGAFRAALRFGCQKRDKHENKTTTEKLKPGRHCHFITINANN